MEKQTDMQELKALLEKNGVRKLYHFTDRDNLASIIRHGGLYSWADCADKGIDIPKPGSDQMSRSLDARDGLEHYVRVSFVTSHPMMFVAMNDGRISNPVILEVDPEVVCRPGTLFADRNATKNGARLVAGADGLRNVHFDAVKARKHFDLPEEEQMFYQAEVLVKNFIPLEYITNIGNFGITLPSRLMQGKLPYTAQITRSTPTAFIFLIDQSVSMQKTTRLYGKEMSMAEAVARIVNHQLNELVLRCVKGDEMRHYYDTAVIGYGKEAYSGWKGKLDGRDFVTPAELKDHPFMKTMVRKETRTRRGIKTVEVEEVQWVEAEASQSWTRVHLAFDRARHLLEQWMSNYHDKDCYPPTIINITDGEFNGASKEDVLQRANDLKSLFTNDGNVILFNIHISADKAACVLCPPSKAEVKNNDLATTLYEMSSLLPSRYSAQVAGLRNDTSPCDRYTAMTINADMSALIQLMDIGTPTNISQN